MKKGKKIIFLIASALVLSNIPYFSSEIRAEENIINETDVEDEENTVDEITELTTSEISTEELSTTKIVPPVVEEKPTPSPKTGDSFNLISIVSLMGISLFGIAVMVIRKRRKKD